MSSVERSRTGRSLAGALVLGGLAGAAGCDGSNGGDATDCNGTAATECTGGQAGADQGGGGGGGTGGTGGSTGTPCSSISGVQVVTAQAAPVAPSKFVSVQADCPAGHVAIGGGAQFVDMATGQTGDGMLISSLPAGGPGEPPLGWIASGSTQYTAQGGLGPSTQLVTYAICAAAGVAAISSVTQPLEVTSPPKYDVGAKVDCPAGQTALSGGMRFADASGPKDGMLMRSMPVFDPGAPPTGWVAAGSAKYLAGNGPADRIDVEAVCAGVCAEVGIEVVPSLSETEALAYHFAQVDCPPGKVAIGGGVRFGKGGTNADGMVMRSMPVFAPGGPPTGWIAAGSVQYYGDGGEITAGDTIFAYAVCAAVSP
jgi:hypothetical protein